MTATLSEHKNEEIEFMQLGLVAFFDASDDKNIDWFEFFKLEKQ